MRRSIFLCFFLRIRLRRFFTSEPMKGERIAGRDVQENSRRAQVACCKNTEVQMSLLAGLVVGMGVCTQRR